MGHFHLTPGRRLLLFLLDGGGIRTVLEISRRNADGRLLAKARPELGDLITEEVGRAKASKRPVRRIILTMKGLAAAQALRPGWQPRRLTTDVLKAWLRELQAERNEWACQFIKDAADAAELRRLRAINWIRPPLKRPGPPKGYMPRNGFQERQLRKIPGRENVAPAPIGGTQWSPALSILPSPPAPPLPVVRRPSAPIPTPPPSSDAEFYQQYVRQNFQTPYVSRPAAADVPSSENERIRDRIIRKNYRDALLPNGKVWFDNREITLAQWEKENPE